jgi:hypothetical protein
LHFQSGKIGRLAYTILTVWQMDNTFYLPHTISVAIRNGRLSGTGRSQGIASAGRQDEHGGSQRFLVNGLNGRLVLETYPFGSLQANGRKMWKKERINHLM